MCSIIATQLAGGGCCRSDSLVASANGDIHVDGGRGGGAERVENGLDGQLLDVVCRRVAVDGHSAVTTFDFQPLDLTPSALF